MIWLRDIFSVDSTEIDDGVAYGDDAPGRYVSSTEDIIDTSSCIYSPSDRVSDCEVKFARRAAIRLERGCLLCIGPRAVKLTLEAWAHPAGFLSGSPLFARLSDCPYTAKVRALSGGLGGGEKRLSRN